MKKLLTLLLILCTFTAFAQMRGGSQYDPGAARANLTNIASGSALAVANGGTGKTTAAEALAALGGASLNGSSTVAFNASTINGVAPLTAAEKIQALVGSSNVDFSAKAFFGHGKITQTVGLSGTNTPLTSLLGVSSINPYGKISLVNYNGLDGYADFAVAGTAVTMIVDGGNFGTATGASTINLFHDGNTLVVEAPVNTGLVITADFAYTP